MNGGGKKERLSMNAREGSSRSRMHRGKLMVIDDGSQSTQTRHARHEDARIEEKHQKVVEDHEMAESWTTKWRRAVTRET